MNGMACSRRSLLLGGVLLVASCAAGAGPSLSPDADAAVDRVQAWFDGLTSLEARFLEIEPDGSTREGTVLYARGGRLRLDYAPGDRLVVIASNGRITAVDRSTGAVTRMPARATPLGLLLGSSVRLRGDGIAVTSAASRPGVTQISLAPVTNRLAGLLTIVFGIDAGGHLVLSEIDAVDDARRRTVFRFFDVTENGSLADRRFEAP